jgi:DNA-binding transcriptional MerR regulator
MARRIPKDAMTRALTAAGGPADPASDAPAPAAEIEELIDLDDIGEDDDGQGTVIVDDEAVPDKLYFRIGEVASLVGVDAHVLRYWESEFRMKPHRSSSGQRLYRKQDLARFYRIKRLLHDEGYTISGARKVLTGSSGQAVTVDVPRVREALDRVQLLRDRILELRDELDPDGRA